MQTRITKLPVISKGKNHENDYIASWRFEAWENGISLEAEPVINEVFRHDFFKYPSGNVEDYNKQQLRIDKYLKEKMVECVEKYLAEKDMTSNEIHLDAAADSLKATADVLYGEN